MYERAAPAVVIVLSHDRDNTATSYGSGFFFEPGIVATAYHVIHDAASVVIRTFDQRDLIGTLIGFNAEADLALIRVDGAETVPILPTRTTTPRIGEELLALGVPRGMAFSLTQGIASGIRTVRGFTHIQTQAPVSRGNSGGPLIDLHGNAVGVVVFKRIDGENMNFAIAVAHLADVPRTLGIRWPGEGTPHAAPTPTPPPTAPPLVLEIPRATDEALKMLPPHQRAAVEKWAQWYIVLPDGRCVNAYRTLATLDALTLRDAGHDRPRKEVYALGLHNYEERNIVRIEGDVPPWHEAVDGCLIVSGIASQGTLTLTSVHETLAIAEVTLGNRHVGPMLVTGPWLGSDSLGTQSKPFVLVFHGTSNFGDSQYPLYAAFPMEQARATPADLAHAIRAEKARLIVYTFTRDEHQPVKTIDTGRRFERFRTVPDGPRVTRFRWRETVRPLRFNLTIEPPLDAGEEREPSPGEEAPEIATAQEAPPPIITHTLHTRDGRVLHGRLLHHGDRVRFVVVVGRLEQETEILSREVLSIQEFSDARPR